MISSPLVANLSEFSPRESLRPGDICHANLALGIQLPRRIEAHRRCECFEMATIRPMRPNDLLRISSTNLDHLTETYNIGFYLEYLTKWPELCQIIEGIDGEIEGYSRLPHHDPCVIPQHYRAY